VKKILSILLALGVILGLTVTAAPVAAQPCVCPTGSTPIPIDDLLAPPNPVDFCAGQISDYEIGNAGTPILTPQALLSDTDKFSVDFPADTDLSGIVAADVIIQPWGGSPAAITVSGQHLEFVIPWAAFAADVIPMSTAYWLEVHNVLNPTVSDTYCLYVDFCDDAICTPIQFDCGTYFVAPAQKIVDFHFDFSATFTGIAEDYIPPFKACGLMTDAPNGINTVLIAGDYYYDFDLILRDENGGCSNPCTTPSRFWFEVTKCPPGETINLQFDPLNVYACGGPIIYALTDANIGTQYSLLPCWGGWPPGDVPYQIYLHVTSPGDYELQFFVECPAGGCPLCGGPTVVATGVLPFTAFQFLDASKVDLEEKWDLVSLPLFPYDTSIASVLGSMDRIDQLVSAWYFDQCEDPAPDAGVWHSAVYDAVAGTFAGDLTDLRAGNAYWIRTLHAGETGYVAGPNGFWVFGSHAIMPTPTGVDMGSFDVCEGWNMVGFKPPWVGVPLAPTTQVDGNAGAGYLWNYGAFGQVNYGLIYEWNSLPLPGDWTTWLPTFLTMNPGEGYWIPFDGDGEIYPSS
jgi:hypothetical protein